MDVPTQDEDTESVCKATGAPKKRCAADGIDEPGGAGTGVGGGVGDDGSYDVSGTASTANMGGKSGFSGTLALSEIDGDEYADEPDETLAERLWGLTEMFPESLRNAAFCLSDKAASSLKCFYSVSRNAVWIFVSSSVILFAPLIFEVERAQMEDMQRSQQKQMLLGPNTAMAGGQSGVPMPPIR